MSPTVSIWRKLRAVARMLGDRLLEEWLVRAYQENVDCRPWPSAGI